MRVYVYTLTRDRLEYTKRAFKSLREKAGYPYRHIVIDNGSEDGTADWLRKNSVGFDGLILNPENLGISQGSNQALDLIREEGGADLVIKMDNDCEILSDSLILELVALFYEMKVRKPLGSSYVLSPKVEKVIHSPVRVREEWWTKHKLGVASLVGGLFHCVLWDNYSKYRYPDNLPLAWGQDDYFCDWFNKQGGTCAYVEHLRVAHMDGTAEQAKKYPEYFKRKVVEEGGRCLKD